MPDTLDAVALLPGPRTRDTEGEKHQTDMEKGLIHAGLCSWPMWEEEPLGGLTGDDLTHKETQCKPGPIKKLDWLLWCSNGLEHGLKRHKIAKNGYVYETGDRPTEPRRKSKAVSSRQFEGRC